MKQFRLSNGERTFTIYKRSQKDAENSAVFDYLMGDGPLFKAVEVVEVDNKQNKREGIE
jgi:hypothetical protein